MSLLQFELTPGSKRFAEVGERLRGLGRIHESAVCKCEECRRRSQ